MGHKKDEYHKLTSLYVKQKWLITRRAELRELIDFCDDNDSKDLVFSLLERFSYLESETLNMLLNDIADYIVNKSGFKQETTQILSMTYDDEADSGQKVLDEIKHPIFKKGWRSIKTVNAFGKAIKNYKLILKTIIYLKF